MCISCRYNFIYLIPIYDSGNRSVGFFIIFLSEFFLSSRRRHTRWPRDWSSDVCSSDLEGPGLLIAHVHPFDAVGGAHGIDDRVEGVADHSVDALDAEVAELGDEELGEGGAAGHREPPGSWRAGAGPGAGPYATARSARTVGCLERSPVTPAGADCMCNRRIHSWAHRPPPAPSA